MANKYPNIDDYTYGQTDDDDEEYSSLRSKTTIELINRGYTVVNTEVYENEHVILAIDKIERIKSFTVEFIHPHEHAISSPSEDGSFKWKGAKIIGGHGYNDYYPTEVKIQTYRKSIEDQKILSHQQEYELALISPEVYQQYLTQVLTPQERTPKLSNQEQHAASRRRQAALARKPYTPPDPKYQDDIMVDYPKIDFWWFNLPSVQSVPRLYQLFRRTKKPLSKDQETVLLEKGLIGKVDYALEYYKLLAHFGLTPAVSYQEMRELVDWRLDVRNAEPFNPDEFIKKVKAIFN